MRKIVSIITLLFIGSVTSYAQINTDSTTGNVGIGTTTPSSKLDIVSNAAQQEKLMNFEVEDAPGDYLQIHNATGGAGQFIPSIKGFHKTDSRASLYIVGATSYNMDTGSNALIDFNARRENNKIQNRPLFSWTNYTTKMMTMTSNGNLGIGTTSPVSKLDLGKNYSNPSIFPNKITLWSSGSNNYFGFGISNGDLDYFSQANHRFYTEYNGTPGSEKMVIQANGNIGIGTTTPTAKLEINSTGAIHSGTHSLIVKDLTRRGTMLLESVTDNPTDFVFKNNNRKSWSVSSRASSDNYALRFFPSQNGTSWGAPTLSLHTDGNVGIGTTTPSEKLDVKGSISLTSGNDLPFKIWAGGSGNSNHMRIGTDNGHSGDAALEIYQNYKGGDQQKPGKVIVNGNVGIGTTTPQAGLHIVNNNGLFIDDTINGFPGRLSMSDGFTNAVNVAKDDFLFESDGAFIFKLDRNGNGISNLPGFGVYDKNNQSIFFAKDNGNVGIGTNTPEANLEVSSANDGDAILRIEADEDNNNESDNPMIQFRQDGGQLGINMGFSEENFGGNIFGIGTRYTSQESWNAFSIDTQNGNVGIGTTTPAQKFEVNAKDSAIQVRLQRTGSNTGMTDFGTDNTGLHYWVGGYDGFGKEEFFIGTNGNVGIGTNNTKGYKLGVNGSIAATEVKVALYNAWPDYVFEEAYELPSLEEVENHIITNGHLSNIPSAAEVAENGIQLGEMNAKLLEKIEELTLYTIEQEKKLKSQEERLAKLEALLLKK